MPPQQYAQESYTAPDGHAATRDYYLGFDYGKDVAVASGRRASGTAVSYGGSPAPAIPYVPAAPTAVKPAPPLTSDSPAGASKFDAPAEALPPLPGSPGGAKRPVPPLPKPELPIIKPFNPPLPDDLGTKFSPTLDPDRLPVQSLPLPKIEPLPVPPDPIREPLLPVPNLELPTPVPLSALGEVPVIPFHFDPAVVPAGAIVPRK